MSSNYPNMSYCQCENTLRAMQQVLTNMQEHGGQFLSDMSREEFRAFQELFNACEDFIRLGEEVDQEFTIIQEQRCAEGCDTDD